MGVFDYADRRRRLDERMREAAIDLLFLPPSSDLEYLTGVERVIPTFGQSQYAHGWVAGAFFRPERAPVFVLPRMMTLFDVAGELPGELVVVGERDDGPALFDAAARERARAEVEPYLGVVARLDPTLELEPGAEPPLDRFVLAGTPEEVAAQARRLVDAGASRIEFGTPQGMTTRGGVDLLARDVLPLLRA